MSKPSHYPSDKMFDHGKSMTWHLVSAKWNGIHWECMYECHSPLEKMYIVC